MTNGSPDGNVAARDGTRIAWFRIGDGPPLVLVHGAAADHTTFRVVGPMLARRHTVYAIDRRGRGASGDTLPYAIEREYEDVAAVVDELAAGTGGPVDVVGHSFGGRVALGAAPLTRQLGRLVTYESAPAPPGMTFEPDGLIARLRALDAAGSPAELFRTFLADAVGLTPDEIAAYEASPVWPARVTAAPTIIRELAAESATDDAAAAARFAAGIRVPVLQLLGGDSRPVFALGTAALDRALPDGRVVVLPGQRHAAHHTDPERFVTEVEAFLGRP